MPIHLRLPLRAAFVTLAALTASTAWSQSSNSLAYPLLHVFSLAASNDPADDDPINADGIEPDGGLVLAGGVLYGTTVYGGAGGSGVIFRVNRDGTDFTNLYSFAAAGFEPSTGGYTNSDGAYPAAALLVTNGTIFGTTTAGNPAGGGTVFRINTNGAGFTNLYGFAMTVFDAVTGNHTNAGGASPGGALILYGNALYGTTTEGNPNGYGTLFSITTNGQNFTNLVLFNVTNGAAPYSGLTQSNGTFYGTTIDGGANSNGLVFRVNYDGTRFTNLYSFGGELISSAGYQTNKDGANPYGALVLAGPTLFGTAAGGGAGGAGTVFRVNTDGTAFTNLYNFSAPAYDGATGLDTNREGFGPATALTLLGATLFGAAPYGASNAGAIFSLNTNGAGFVDNYIFPPASTAQTNSGGANPVGPLVISAGIAYGVGEHDGPFGNGVIFGAIVYPAPPLQIQRAGNLVVISWTNAAFSLQAAASVAGPYTNVAGASSPCTNAVAGTAAFYRLQAQ